MGFLTSTTSGTSVLNEFLYNLIPTGKKTKSGEQVSEQTALSLPVFYACMRAIAEDVAKLPILVYKRDANGVRQRQDGHHVEKFLERMNPNTISFSVREATTGQAEIYGFGIEEIERNEKGEPIASYPICSERVNPYIHEGEVYWCVRVDDLDVYAATRPGDKEEKLTYVAIPDEDALVIRGMGKDGLVGHPVLQIGAESIGLSLAAQSFGASWFGNGAMPSMVLVHPKVIKDDARKRLRESWQERHKGAGNSNKLAVLEEGMEIKPIGIPPDQSQFLETRQFQIEEICRWFRIPPVKVQHNQDTPYANVESLNLAYVQDSLTPWLKRWEEECNRKLFSQKEQDQGYFVKHNTAELLRGDSAAVSNMMRERIATGVWSVNESRSLDDLPPVDGGDEHYMQQGFTTLPRIAAGENTSADNSLENEPENEPENTEDETGAEDAALENSPNSTPDETSAEALRPVVHSICAQIIKREVNAIAKKKDASEEWIAEWRQKQYEGICGNLSPVCASWASMSGRESWHLVANVIHKHSKGELGNADDFAAAVIEALEQA